jgi:hypothetical protein
MKKDFYVVIPFDKQEDQSVKSTGIFWVFKNFWRAINNGDDITKIRQQIRDFGSMKKWLSGRANTVKSSLESIGIRATELEKSELVNLLSEYYNPTLWNLRPMKSDVSEYNLV